MACGRTDSDNLMQVGHVSCDAQESRLGKSEQGDKWSFCLTAGKMSPRIRRTNKQTSTPEPHTSADAPLINAEILFRQPGPPHNSLIRLL
jgi:hypothetical protein